MRATRQSERIDGEVAPAAVEAGAQHVIQQVVTRRNRVEHAGNARGGLVDGRRSRPPSRHRRRHPCQAG